MKAVKSPSYQFYYKEWYISTRCFTRQQRDIYRELLDFSYDQNGLEDDLKVLYILINCRTKSEKVDLRDLLKKKFKKCEDGRLRNETLEKVRKEQDDYRAKRSEAGRAGAKAKNEGGNRKVLPEANGVANGRQNTSSTSTSTSVLDYSSNNHPPNPQGGKSPSSDQGGVPVKDEGASSKITEAKELFDLARRAYPAQRNGLDSEWENFLKKYKKTYPDIIPRLLPAIEYQIAFRSWATKENKFAADWKGFRGWINNAYWNEEHPEYDEYLKRRGAQPEKRMQVENYYFDEDPDYKKPVKIFKAHDGKEFPTHGQMLEYSIQNGLPR